MAGGIHPLLYTISFESRGRATFHPRSPKKEDTIFDDFCLARRNQSFQPGFPPR